MSRGNRPDQRAASSAADPAAADEPTDAEHQHASIGGVVRADTPSKADPSPTAPSPPTGPGPVRWVVTHGTVKHDGRDYVTGEFIPVSEAQAMLMPWAIERR